MEELESIMAELDVIKQMAELLKSLDAEGKRRALWYLADIAGLSTRPAQRPAVQPPVVNAAGAVMPGEQPRVTP